MSFNFRESAKKEVSLSELMANREKLETEDVIGKEVTIREFDIVVLDAKPFAVVLLDEFPDRFYNGGFVLTKLCQNWAEAFDGDIRAASEELKDSGGVVVRFTATKTKKGNNLTSIEVL